MRYSEEVLKMVYNKYAPRTVNVIKTKEKNEETGKMDTVETEETIIDPRVLYVGPFLDGVGLYLSEMFNIPFPNSGGPENARRHLKSMLADTMAGDRARNLMTRDLRMRMSRPTWKPDTRSGRVPTVLLNDRLRDVEPGELINSPQVVQNPETGEREVMEQISEGNYKPFVPIIREDKRFGLHYLMVDDAFSVSFKTRQNHPVELSFRLRPLGEGSSLLTPEQSFEEVSW